MGKIRKLLEGLLNRVIGDTSKVAFCPKCGGATVERGHCLCKPSVTTEDGTMWS